MTSPTLQEEFRSGGGNYAVVFHPAGLPWAVTTHPSIISQLDSPASDADARAYRQLLFGRQTVTIAGPTIYYPSDDVQLIAGLDSQLGSQTIKYDEGKGITGSSHRVKFKREGSGLNYDNIRDGAVNGVYDALDLVPDPMYDGNIATAMLASEFRDTTDDLVFYNDDGLYDAICSQLDSYDVCYLWALNTTLVVTDDPVDNGDGTFTVDADDVRSGAFRSVRERLFPSDFDGASLLIANAPINGIVGRPGNMWLIPLDENDNIRDLDQAPGASLDDYPSPYLVRSGPIAPDPRGTNDSWELTVHHWTQWLDVDIPTDRPVGQLKGFRLSRQPAGLANQVQRAHLSLIEENSGTWTEYEIWLCDEGEEVYYEDIAALKAAVISEFADALAGTSTYSDQPTHLYFIQPDGLVDLSDPAEGLMTYVGGSIPWILDWNFHSGSYVDDLLVSAHARWDHYTSDAVDQLNSSGSGNNANWDAFRLVAPFSSGNIDHWVQYKYYNEALYYYQYPYARLTHAALGDVYLNSGMWPPPPVPNWPIPKQVTAGDHRLEFQDDFDAQLLSTGSDITIGTGGLKLTGTITSVGPGYCITDTSDVWDTIPTLKNNNTSWPRWGSALACYPNAYTEALRVDPWVVSQSSPVTSSSIVKLLRGVLGDEETTGQDMPSRLRLYHIPDLFNDSSYNEDMRELIDWDKLELLTSGIYPNSDITIPMSGEINIKDELSSLLLNFSVRETWGISESQRAERLSFEEFGTVSGVQASNAGRVIDEDAIEIDAEPVDTHGGTWLYRDVEGKLNYSDEGEAELELTARNRTGLATQVSVDKTLKIDSKLMHIDDSDKTKLINTYRNILANVNQAHPTTSILCTPKLMTLATVGSSAMITTPRIWNFLSATRGVTDLAALLTSTKTTISAPKFTIKTTIRCSPYSAQGWAPGMIVDPDAEGVTMSLSGSTITITGLPTTAANSVCVNDTGGLTDLATFGCFKWSDSTDEIEEKTTCSCDEYRVWIFDRSARTYYTSGVNKNVWTAKVKGHSTDTLVLDDIENGRCRIELLDAVESFNDETAKVVKFADRDHADLQPCQTLYGFYGDKNGQVEDSDGNKHRAFSWTG